MGKLEVSLVTCLIVAVVLGTSTFYFYDLNVLQESQNELLTEQTIALQSDKKSLITWNRNLESENRKLQSKIDLLESQVKNAYDEGYVQGVIDGAESGFNIRNPTYQEVINFIAQDRTDKNGYDYDDYNCFHFTADVEKNAFEAGYRCGFTYVEFPDGAHAIVAFNTIDQGLIFVEPQDDEIVNLAVGQPYWDDIVVNFVIIW